MCLTRFVLCFSPQTCDPAHASMRTHSDEATVVADELSANIPANAREQVLTIFTDDPSEHFYTELKLCFPNLQNLCLDITHLAMVYEYGTWRKRTPGSKMLRAVLHKFSVVDRLAALSSWGPVFLGGDARQLDVAESKARQRILDGSMPKWQAERVLETMNFESPFYTRVEFVEALAALSRLHPEDMDRKAPGPNKAIRQILWSAAAPARLEWMFNNIRCAASYNPGFACVLIVGSRGLVVV